MTQHGKPTAKPIKAANDNQPESPPEKEDGSPTRPRLVVLCSLPGRLPILDGEVALVEAYLSDLIGEIIANDN